MSIFPVFQYGDSQNRWGIFTRYTAGNDSLEIFIRDGIGSSTRNNFYCIIDTGWQHLIAGIDENDEPRPVTNKSSLSLANFKNCCLIFK